MLLNDIGKLPDSVFKKINLQLETNYGFKISEDSTDKDLVAIMEQIQDEITDLKIRGEDAKVSPEISKRLLILEGIKQLREFALVQFESPDLGHVVEALSDFIADSFRLSGTTHQDFEECVRDGMKHYRSSRYRFPDDLIEQRVRQGAMTRIHGPSIPENMGMEEGPIGMAVGGAAGGALGTAAGTAMGGPAGAVVGDVIGTGLGSEVGDHITNEKWGGDVEVHHTGQNTNKSVAELRHERAAAKKRGDTKAVHQKDFAIRAKTGWGKVDEKDLEEDDSGWAGVGKRAGAHGGHVAAAPTSALGKKAAKVLDRPELSLEPMSSEPADPFAKHAAELRKGIVHKRGTMKENLVKRLRTLLETEVSQAEVMMAAKGFAQELQEMIEKIGRLQNEDLPPVTDQMRETYGTESSSAFQTQIYGALQGVMDSLYTAKGQVDDAVSSMASTGMVGAQTDLDVDVGMGGDEMGGDLDLDNLAGDIDAEAGIEPEGEMGDEFGGAEVEEPLGRSMKAESLQRKIAQMKTLVEKAKKLKEAKRNG